MTSATEQAFSSTAALYDRHRSRLIPCFDALYGWATELLPPDANRVLDLGAGTGLLSMFVRARLPEAELHLVDFSEAMLAQARARFAGDARVTVELADYAAGSLQGSYDAVVSALSIHHLEQETKQQLFRAVLDVLLPGGVFINAEQVLGPTPVLETRYRELWLQQVRALGTTEQELAASLYRQQEDRCATVEEQLGWMRTAGFRDVDCWFKDGRFAVLAGSRPQQRG